MRNIESMLLIHPLTSLSDDLDDSEALTQNESILYRQYINLDICLTDKQQIDTNKKGEKFMFFGKDLHQNMYHLQNNAINVTFLR